MNVRHECQDLQERERKLLFEMAGQQVAQLFHFQ